MLLRVDDELLFEVPEAETGNTAQLVKAVMEAACESHCEFLVPLVCQKPDAAGTGARRISISGCAGACFDACGHRRPVARRCRFRCSRGVAAG